MIKIVARSVIKPGKKEEFLSLAEELIAESRKEKGCMSYDLYEDINNPNCLAFIEEWKDEEAIKIHNASPHFTTVVPKLGELREKSPEINLYKIID
ncbi:putative quinol monooxygenase [Anaerosalibacter massiliensis]|uniref:Antibiotic biosynthesis monooxygenase n=1 Tax=Anaerosalibacter massiliensis TaxID=1347392 RepID=A0A9X2MHC9_9FIRM|nr:putative quinol monooxygenase [Anaerosalibacter massiliensis]MCR2044058.1 antibiotic biosynthesis monooxygenase [Anaerosalibacter massiliensis]